MRQETWVHLAVAAAVALLAACGGGSVRTSVATRADASSTTKPRTTTTTAPFVPSDAQCRYENASNLTEDQIVQCSSWLAERDTNAALADQQEQDRTFDAIKAGMTLADVRRLTGVEGTLESSATVAGSTSEIWTLGPAIVSFQDGRVVGKTRRH